MADQRVLLGDCLDVFRDIRGLQAIVTDPPAGIKFMRAWDTDHGGRSKWIGYWAERFAVALDACDDDAVGLFWALPRTSHWTATAVEDAGWRIRDVITHHFGQGWPKDKNALKPASEHWILAIKGKPALGIDACRVERGSDNLARINGTSVGRDYGGSYGAGPNTAARRAAEGLPPLGSWPTNAAFSHAEGCERVGTRKVASGTAIRRNGVGQSNIYGDNAGFCAVGSSDLGYASTDGTETVPAYLCAVGCDCGASWLAEAGGKAPRCACGREGWWACPVAEMDTYGCTTSIGGTGDKSRVAGSMFGRAGATGGFGDTGSVSRFFPRFTYHAKAPSGERHAGCEDFFWRVDKRDPFGFVRVSREEWEALDPRQRAEGNVHPTVKRLALMRWLHRLTGAKRVGDFCGGSGSGMVAAYLDDIDWIGAEVCPQAIEIANARLAFWRGLSYEARERFLSDDVMPKAEDRDERQHLLFAV